MRSRERLMARQRRTYDQAAARYDRAMRPLERMWFTGGRAWLGERARGRVLEVGIGTGANLPHYPDGVTLTGIDLSDGMLAVARERAARLGIPVDLRQGDAQHLPCPDASADTVVCALALCCVPDPAATITEMRRVLVPGGRMLLLDHVASTNPLLRAAQWLLERVTVPLEGEHFTRRQLPLVEAAGFTIEEAERHRAGTVERICALAP